MVVLRSQFEIPWSLCILLQTSIKGQVPKTDRKKIAKSDCFLYNSLQIGIPPSWLKNMASLLVS
jgi:hypothetical protein